MTNKIINQITRKEKKLKKRIIDVNDRNFYIFIYLNWMGLHNSNINCENVCFLINNISVAYKRDDKHCKIAIF